MRTITIKNALMDICFDGVTHKEYEILKHAFILLRDDSTKRNDEKSFLGLDEYDRDIAVRMFAQMAKM